MLAKEEDCLAFVASGPAPLARRTHHGPQWYASGKNNDKPGFGVGLRVSQDAAPNNRVFASTADVPMNFPKVPRRLRSPRPALPMHLAKLAEEYLSPQPADDSSLE